MSLYSQIVFQACTLSFRDFLLSTCRLAGFFLLPSSKGCLQKQRVFSTAKGTKAKRQSPYYSDWAKEVLALSRFIKAALSVSLGEPRVERWRMQKKKIWRAPEWRKGAEELTREVRQRLYTTIEPEEQLFLPSFIFYVRLEHCKVQRWAWWKGYETVHWR